MSPFDHAPRLSSLSIRLADSEPELLPPGMGPPGRCAGAAAPPLSPSLRFCRPAPMRVVAGEHCLPQEGECLRSTTYPDCRCCLFAGLCRSRCPRAGPAWSLRRGSCGQLPCRPRRSSVQGCAGAAALQPSPFPRCCRSAPLRVVADEHCVLSPCSKIGVYPFDQVPASAAGPGAGCYARRGATGAG